jgi:Xaa-Pro aminopeptidase
VRFFDYDRAAQLMAAQGLDVLLAQTPTNTVYLSDHQCPWASSTVMLEDGRTFYATFVGVPRDDGLPPFMVTTLSEEGHVLYGQSWIHDVRYWGTGFVIEGRQEQTGFVSDPVELVAQALEERGLAASCIGLEMEHLPITFFNRLRARLPLATFANAWPVLWALRAIKHPEEIRRMRLAAHASEKAIQAAFAAAREGIAEIEMESVLARVVAEEGCRYEWSSVAFGTKGAMMVGPTSNQLKRGDIVRIDLVASYQGWLSDMSRNAVFGVPSPRMVDAHDAVRKTNALVQSAIRPGISCDELYRIGAAYMQTRGYRMLTEQVGHGVGRNSNEPPFLTHGVKDRLQPDMIVTVEIPLRLVDVGSINVEDLLLVTEEGNEPLTTMTADLQRLGQ